MQVLLFWLSREVAAAMEKSIRSGDKEMHCLLYRLYAVYTSSTSNLYEPWLRNNFDALLSRIPLHEKSRCEAIFKKHTYKGWQLFSSLPSCENSKAVFKFDFVYVPF